MTIRRIPAPTETDIRAVEDNYKAIKSRVTLAEESVESGIKHRDKLYEVRGDARAWRERLDIELFLSRAPDDLLEAILVEPGLWSRAQIRLLRAYDLIFVDGAGDISALDGRYGMSYRSMKMRQILLQAQRGAENKEEAVPESTSGT